MVRSSLPTSIRSATAHQLSSQDERVRSGPPGSQDGVHGHPRPRRQPVSPPRAAGRRDEAAPRARATYRWCRCPGVPVMAAAMFMYVRGSEFEILGLSVLVFTQTRLAFSDPRSRSARASRRRPSAARCSRRWRPAAAAPGRRGGPAHPAVPGLATACGRAAGPGHAGAVAAAATTAPVFQRRALRSALRGADGDRYVLGRSVFGRSAVDPARRARRLAPTPPWSRPARPPPAAGGALAANAARSTRLGLRPRPARGPRRPRPRDPRAKAVNPPVPVACRAADP